MQSNRLVGTRTRSCMASVHVSSQGLFAEPGLRRQRRELAPRGLLLLCNSCSMQVEELVLEVLPLPCLLHLASKSWQFSSYPPTKTSNFGWSAIGFWACNLLKRGVITVQWDSNWSRGLVLCVLAREKNLKGSICFWLTNECWKTFSENYGESWHFAFASFV